MKPIGSRHLSIIKESVENIATGFFAAVSKESSSVYSQLVRKRTRPALETIMFNAINPGMHIQSDEHKSYYWLGHATKCDPMRPAICMRSTFNHSKTFKDKETGTHANKVKGQNSLLKGPYKKLKGLPKKLIPECLD